MWYILVLHVQYPLHCHFNIDQCWCCKHPACQLVLCRLLMYGSKGSSCLQSQLYIYWCSQKWLYGGVVMQWLVLQTGDGRWFESGLIHHVVWLDKFVTSHTKTYTNEWLFSCKLNSLLTGLATRSPHLRLVVRVSLNKWRFLFFWTNDPSPSNRSRFLLNGPSHSSGPTFFLDW